jgi:transposase
MAESSTSSSHTPAVSRREFDALLAQNAELTRQLDWFRRQLFGSKSEKQVMIDPHQLHLGEEYKAPADAEDTRAKKTITYQRGIGPKVRPEDCVTDIGLRFDDSVPQKIITLPVLELQGLSPEQFELIEVKKYYRLAQRPASYVVMCYEQPVYKLLEQKKIVNAITPMSVLDKSVADVSFLVGLLVDKFQYHLPLYRQHQRLEAAGITLSRTTLTNLVRRSIALLEPVVDAQMKNILRSRVLAMDETPIKAGKSKKKKGRMHQGYYWPLYGDQDEIVFTYSESRARRVIEQLLDNQFSGTLLSDGYKAYASYAAKTEGVVHAQCWVHTRRQFFEARDSEPAAVDEMLQRIGLLYKHEEAIREQSLEGESKREYRLLHSKPVVDEIFEWLVEQKQAMALLPSDPFTKALNYLDNRAIALRVFLENPDVQMDTNHLERGLRPIPMGRKSWLFCWTELGAEQVGIIQSLISTCKLHDVNPFVYLTDVLQRIQIHPNKDIEQLTPRLWKEHFADDPFGSDLDLNV